MYAGNPTSHSDASAPDGAPNNGDYEAPTSFEEYQKKDGYDTENRRYGAIEERVWDTRFTSPVDDVETLHDRSALAVQFHDENRDYWKDETPYRNDGGVLYDLKILDVCKAMLAEEGVDDFASEVFERRVRVCFLRVARNQSGTELHEYLTKPDPVCTAVHRALGYSGPSYSTLQRAYEGLEQSDTIQWGDFKAAVTRAVYAVFRAGIVAPEPVMEEHGFDELEPPVEEAAVPRSVEKNELRRSIRKLAERTLDPIDFDRAPQQTSHEIMAFIAACAASAQADKGLEDLKDVCDWNYPRAEIPGGGWARNYITERLSLDGNSTLYDFSRDRDHRQILPINDQFDAVRRRMLNLAGDLGFWKNEESVTVAIDMFRIDWSGDSLVGGIQMCWVSRMLIVCLLLR